MLGEPRAGDVILALRTYDYCTDGKPPVDDTAARRRRRKSKVTSSWRAASPLMRNGRRGRALDR